MRKRSLFPVLIFCVLLAALMPLSSCSGGAGQSEGTTEEQTQVAKIDIDLTEYKIIRPSTMAQDPLQEVVRFRKSIGEKVGEALAIFDDWVKGGELTEETLQAKEILIGKTNRPQSAQALEDAGKEGAFFVIAVSGPKIVVNASADELLGQAVDQFLSMIDGKTLTISENYLWSSESSTVLDVVKNGETDFKIVYHEGLDTTISATNEKDKCDLEVQAAKDLRDVVKSAAGVTILLSDDWYKPGDDVVSPKEILVGYNVNRDETKQFLSSIGYADYGFAAIGNKIVVAGWNLSTTQLAVDMFYDYISAAARTSGKNISMTTGYRSVKTLAGFYTDFPEFTGGTLTGSYDCNDKTLEFYYEKATADGYAEYCTKLENGGFKLYQKNDIAGNLSATYEGSEGMIHVMFIPKDKTVRLITSPAGKYSLPDYTTKEAVPAYTKITDPKITQLSFNYDAGNFGMCYIITLSDGSFVVFDGGGYNSSYGDDSRLFNALKGLNKRTDGKICIAAWFVTHEHWDHFLNFCNMASSHTSQIVIEKCYFNLPAAANVTNANNPNYYYSKNFPSMSSAYGGLTTVKLHTGMKFWIRDAEFEVLATQEDNYPSRCNYFNETTTVTRMKLGGNTVMWLGDAKNYASKVMINRYGDYIKSDIVQVAHHGYDGVQQGAYVLMAPKTLLWPTSASNFETQITGKTYAVDKYLYDTVGRANIIVADKVRTITLPFANGDAIVEESY